MYERIEYKYQHFVPKTCQAYWNIGQNDVMHKLAQTRHN